jgi:16S rRNA (guanine527-N7)-methyltransferase
LKIVKVGNYILGMKTLPELFNALCLDEKQIVKLIELTNIIIKTNQKQNVISKKDESDVWERHILDSLVPGLFFPNSRNIHVGDLGSGFGLPVLPLSIAFPENRFVAIESRSKRTSFIKYVCRELNIRNLEVINSRWEDYGEECVFDVITSRAVCNPIEGFTLVEKQLKNNGYYLTFTTKNDFGENRIPNLSFFEYTLLNGHTYYIAQAKK